MINEIKLITEPEEIKKLYDFIRQFPLKYPDYFMWLEKCKRQLELGEKNAFYAISEGNVMGNIIFQKLKDDSNVLEIKNFRVSEKNRHLGIGSALETVLYSYAKSNDFKKIQVDTHQDNMEMIQFLIKRGYRIESREFLYAKDMSEIILSKKL
jgi:ribosomal protein S18 acetylase RimI-like enzyme